jgi:hypothetical protein
MRRLMLLMLPIALMGCGGSDNSTTGPTLASLSGTWNLQTANGTPLPFTVSSAGGIKTEILSSVVTVAANGTFTQVSQFRTTINGQISLMTLPSSGTISLSGTLVTVTVTGSGAGTGTLNSSTMFTVTDPTTGALFVFVKQ